MNAQAGVPATAQTTPVVGTEVAVHHHLQFAAAEAGHPECLVRDDLHHEASAPQ